MARELNGGAAGEFPIIPMIKPLRPSIFCASYGEKSCEKSCEKSPYYLTMSLKHHPKMPGVAEKSEKKSPDSQPGPIQNAEKMAKNPRRHQLETRLRRYFDESTGLGTPGGPQPAASSTTRSKEDDLGNIDLVQIYIYIMHIYIIVL